MPFDPSQPFDVVSLPQVTRGSTFGWQNGPGSDPGDNGQFAGGGSSTDNPEDYAALPDDSGVPFGYTFPVTSQKTGKTVWVTRRDTGPAAFTGRGVDLAPSAMQKLGADTDEPLTIDTARAVPAFDPSQPFDVVSSKPATPPPAQATPPPAPDKSALDTAYAKEFPAQTADDGNKPWYARVYDTLTKRDNELMKLPVLDRIEQGALDAAEQIDPSGVIRSRLAGPTDFPLPRPFPESNPADSFLAASGKALANAPSDVANYVTSSGGAATLLGLGTLPAMSRALAANAFAATMSNDAIEQLKRGDTQGAVESLAMAAAAGKGARDEFPLNEPKPAEPAAAEAPAAEPAPAEFQGPSYEAAQPEPAINPELGPVIKPEETQPNASSQSSAARIPGQPFRAGLDETAPFREQGAAPAESGATAAATAQRGADVPGDVATPEIGDRVVPPDEQTRQVAESPASTTPGELSGQQQVGEGQPIGDMGTRPGTGETGSGERQGSGTSNRAFGETYGEDVVPAGEGVDTAQLLDNARADIRSGNVDPYAVLSRTRARGIANAEEYATLAAEHERLVNDAVAKQKAGDPGAQEAANAAEDFARAIQPHKTAASDLFRLFQGDVDYDLSTPFGMEQYMKAELGRGMKPGEAPKFNRMSNDIRRGETDMQEAVARSDARVQRRYAKVADIPIEEAAARVKQFLNDCIV